MHALVLNVVKRAIQAVALDGSGARTLVSGLAETPDGIIVDPHHGHIYWTNMGQPDSDSPSSAEPTFLTRNGSLERVDLDGAGRRTIVPAGAFTTGKQLTADFDSGKLYWCDREGMQVLRCDLDGSNLQTLVAAGSGPAEAQDARNHCVGIAVDPIAGHIYWTQKGAPKAGQGKILRAGINIPAGQSAADRQDIEVLWDNRPEPIDLELAPSGILVWTDRGAEPKGNTLNRAFVKPNIGTVQIVSQGYREAIGLATNDGVTYYITELHGGSIRVVNIGDGTDCELINLGPGLTGIALADI
ncbi:hypothetical protein [Mycobacteroides salmoniphilum]|uniref:hypothetical protein n=1 Tax=Mycobacteroides salmoniphilum TaxID=404941 RepID=UPI000993738E|nr:hypothetical protein [Mycobacteroides salmoniphilum]